jgi:hypothetical protein
LYEQVGVGVGVGPEHCVDTTTSKLHLDSIVGQAQVIDVAVLGPND